MKIDRSFKKLANTLPYMLAFVDNKRRYKFVNTAYENFFGVKLKNIKSKTIAEIVGDESYKKISKIHDRVLQGEELELSERVELNDGRSIQLEINYIPNVETLSKRVNGFFAIINDVTEYASAAEVLRAVHDVVNRQSKTLSTDRIAKLLKLGCHYLHAQTGLVSHVTDDDYVVKYAYSEAEDIPADTTFSLGETYCSVTLESNEVVATTHASESREYAGHPCFEKFQLETYLGLPIKINGQTWGTLNFTSPETRLTPFTELDIELMSLICSAIENIIINSSKTKKLEKLAYTDFLTGLSNRLFITERFEELQPNDNQTLNITCFAIIDIDHFKVVNDSYGHDAGDEVLQQTARKIAEQVRASDCVSRVGGEEFVIILMNIPRKNAQSILENIRKKVAGNEILLGNKSGVHVTVSIGATELAVDDLFNTAYKKADIALYQSKKQGRNRLTWHYE
ncbi:MAG TPA: PAS domain S-box protein [Idiomarina abyssalis]|uniref:diguanylate cyclase n=1 Tax=Idiomarina TaxID=135575 RepID=UPI000C404835|nr:MULTISPECIES: diguanylate cyclase [Idiomarina]MAB22312.1 PAS domain S-box protein [Idiomarina sp.]MBE92705.1 PAS domain S-box protein [Idiomarina sp.]MBH95041.1 PAS domain S-box protein [Idiomarina sp.]HAS15192.1 PAS domain S-box protein [Idiomarina abyssalis]|tara:strand:- start:3997 stop:5358 length:1362 start_codon:yes stop_codon:yes gene_type:complete